MHEEHEMNTWQREPMWWEHVESNETCATQYSERMYMFHTGSSVCTRQHCSMGSATKAPVGAVLEIHLRVSKHKSMFVNPGRALGLLQEMLCTWSCARSSNNTTLVNNLITMLITGEQQRCPTRASGSHLRFYAIIILVLQKVRRIEFQKQRNHEQNKWKCNLDGTSNPTSKTTNGKNT